MDRSIATPFEAFQHLLTAGTIMTTEVDKTQKTLAVPSSEAPADTFLPDLSGSVVLLYAISFPLEGSGSNEHTST